MDYIVVALLTTCCLFAVSKLIKRNEKFFIGRPIYRQSDMHNLMKIFFNRGVFVPNKQSQMEKRIDRDRMKVIIIDDKAYWVVDNVFYVADIINDRPDMSTATPVDTTNMSKTDLDKMLFILDNLGRGEKR